MKINKVKMPNCLECGHNKRVTTVEALADDDDHTIYRVCCKGCGRNWLWSYWYFDPEQNERIEDETTTRNEDGH